MCRRRGNTDGRGAGYQYAPRATGHGATAICRGPDLCVTGCRPLSHGGAPGHRAEGYAVMIQYHPLPTPVIEVADLVKIYPGVRAVDGISFSVGAGEIFGLLGPNG